VFGGPQTPADTQKVGNSIIEQLLAQIKGEENPVTQGSADMASVLGGLADTENQNRLTGAGLTQGYDSLMLQAQQGRDASERDALKKLAITGYLKGGGYKGGQPSVMSDGKMTALPSYGSGPQAASEAQVQGATTLEDMLTQRLASGGSYLPQKPTYTTPGALEKGAGYGGAVAGGLGAISNMMGDKSNIYKTIGKGILTGARKIF